MSERLHNDVDPIETRDWLQAIESVIREEGVERAQYLIDQLLSEARKGRSEGCCRRFRRQLRQHYCR